VLTGVNIGRYQCDGHGFCSLLRQLDRINGLTRIRISSIEPNTVGEELIDLMASSAKLCPYLHLPLQSGDDEVLVAMNRRHTVTAYIALIEQALGKIPSLGLGTDLMVGFPGETEAAFKNTMAVATALPFSYLHVFPYSPRPGTAAARMPGAVPSTVMNKRMEHLLDLDRAKRLVFHKAQIGTTVHVLFESETPGEYRVGTAPNFTRVAVAGSDNLQNRIAPTVITAATERWAFGHPVRDQSPETSSLLP
jgi:threonylcarbamoyladenosine tRNA methylthiotransferase MtaB